MANRYYGHLWNGYAIPGTENDEEYVYVTEDSEVYHRSIAVPQMTIVSVRHTEFSKSQNLRERTDPIGDYNLTDIILCAALQKLQAVCPLF